MPRLTKIYTRTGDDGRTALGSGERVPKSAVRIDAYGTVDELNAAIGVALATGSDASLVEPLRRIQNELFHVGAMLCNTKGHDPDEPGPRVEQRHVDELEAIMDRLNAGLPPLKNFVLPGGHPVAAQLHVARTICRRAERLAVQLAESESVGAAVIPYLNRLSDLLFVMARHQNKASGVDEPIWDSRG